MDNFIADVGIHKLDTVAKETRIAIHLCVHKTFQWLDVVICTRNNMQCVSRVYMDDRVITRGSAFKILKAMSVVPCKWKGTVDWIKMLLKSKSRNTNKLSLK